MFHASIRSPKYNRHYHYILIRAVWICNHYHNKQFLRATMYVLVLTLCMHILYEYIKAYRH